VGLETNGCIALILRGVNSHTRGRKLLVVVFIVRSVECFGHVSSISSSNERKCLVKSICSGRFAHFSPTVRINYTILGRRKDTAK
jgi:hypothetical protein